MFKKIFYYRPFADRTLCHFLKQRLSLPVISLEALFENFESQPITLYELPKGAWSTPLMDVVMLLKIAVCTKPKKLMEVGSFRGYTALYLAQHSDPEAMIVTIDSYSEHGEAYRNTVYSTRIERRVGEITPEIFRNDALVSYDLIFLDADHSYQGVKRDTELLLPLVSPTGYLVWHDYANWGYFDGKNGVPEFLAELAADLPIAQINGSDLAVHSPAWKNAKQQEFQRAVQPRMSSIRANPWHSASLRG